MAEPLLNEARWNELVAMIGAAGDYVVPSEDFRPRVLEAAQQKCAERRARFAAGRAFAAAALAAGIAALGARSAGFSSPPKWKDAGQIEQRARENSAVCGGLNWGVVEAFSEARREQSKSLGVGN